MTPAEVIAEVRNVIQDTRATFRYSDPLLLSFVNTTIKRVAILRPDLFTVIGDIPVTANTVIQGCPANAVRLVEIFQVKNGDVLTEVSREVLYVPVLALLAMEQHSVRALVLLALYNLAFISPLVVVFILAAKGADSERMSRWSKRNVVPSKIFLGIVFAVLGYLLWPDFAKYRTAPAEEKVSTGLTRFSGFKSTDNNPVNLVNPVQKDTSPQSNRMSAFGDKSHK